MEYIVMSYKREELLAMGLKDPNLVEAEQEQHAAATIEGRLRELMNETQGDPDYTLVSPKFVLVPSTAEDAATIGQWVGENFDGVCFCHHPERAILDCMSCLQNLARAVARSGTVIDGPKSISRSLDEKLTLDEKLVRAREKIKRLLLEELEQAEAG
jgi:hypothetical protein